MDPSRCVVIELELAAEERLLKYLSGRKSDYNWILEETDEEQPKVRVCVWWRKEKEFFSTPLRSFLKRLKNKQMFDPKVPGRIRIKPMFDPKISGRMSTEEGVQRVCKGVRASISKHHLELPLYPYLSGLLLDGPPGIGEYESNEAIMDGGDPNMLNILGKLNLLLEIVDVIAAHVVKLSEVKRLSEPDENTPSSTITHMDKSDYEPARSFPCGDPFIMASST